MTAGEAAIVYADRLAARRYFGRRLERLDNIVGLERTRGRGVGDRMAARWLPGASTPPTQPAARGTPDDARQHRDAQHGPAGGISVSPSRNSTHQLLLKESLRLLPDLLRLLRRLTTNRDFPKGVRVRVGLLFVYLAIPIDVIPDFIPILGYADDAIVVVLVLRSVCRRVSLEELREAWPGTDDGFAALCRLVRPAAVVSSH
jgi:uncharacterized membrane protein YkvA (DUF1232 family)